MEGSIQYLITTEFKENNFKYVARVHCKILYPEWMWDLKTNTFLRTYLLTYLLTYLFTYLLTYLVDGAGSFLRS